MTSQFLPNAITSRVRTEGDAVIDFKPQNSAPSTSNSLSLTTLACFNNTNNKKNIKTSQESQTPNPLKELAWAFSAKHTMYADETATTRLCQSDFDKKLSLQVPITQSQRKYMIKLLKLI